MSAFNSLDEEMDELDRLAAMAMVGLLANPATTQWGLARIAEEAYAIAGEMIAAKTMKVSGGIAEDMSEAMRRSKK